MHTLFSPGKNILHELFLKQKIFLSFNSPPSPISPPSLENLINTVVFAKKYWSVTQTAGWVCVSLLSVLVLLHVSPLFPNKALETASCSVPGGSQPALLHSPTPIPQARSIELGHWSQSDTTSLYQSPLLATQKGGNKKKQRNPFCIFSLCHLCKPQISPSKVCPQGHAN